MLELRSELTSEIEVDGMGQETFAGNTFKERSDRNEVVLNSVRHRRNCLKPFTVATGIWITSLFRAYHSDSLKNS